MKANHIKTLFTLPLLLSSSLALADSFADFSTATLTGNSFILPDDTGAYTFAFAPTSGTDGYDSTVIESVTNATSFDYSFTVLSGTGTTFAWYELGNGPDIKLSDTTGTDGLTVSLPGYTGDITFGATSTGGDIASALVVSNLNLAPVPEPEEYALMMSGLGMLAWRLRNKSAAAQSLRLA